MTRLPGRALLGVLLAPLALSFGVGCDDEQSRTDLPDWTDGYETGGPISTGGTVVSVDGGVVFIGTDGGIPEEKMGIRIPDGVTWPMRIHQKDKPSLPCEIPIDDPDTELDYAEEKDITCMVEMDELDLFALGLEYDVFLPEGMCEFLFVRPYFYENFEIGVGPETVSYTVNEDGTFENEVNSAQGRPLCDYDHSRGSALFPNCCLGTYTLEVTSTMTGNTSVTSGHPWGGLDRLGDCYYGGAYLDTQASLTPDGFPRTRYVYVGREAYFEHRVYGEIAPVYSSNVALANYSDPDDHGGGLPNAYEDVPGFARPNYEYECVDHAYETIARIRIIVREWNEEKEYDVQGDPDTEGTEDWPDMPPLNDHPDWKDHAEAGQDPPNLLHGG